MIIIFVLLTPFFQIKIDSYYSFLLLLSLVLLNMNDIRKYFLKKWSFENLLCFYIYNSQMREEEDYHYENDCYFNEGLNYLYS